jgi:Rieske Fe-S protein
MNHSPDGNPGRRSFLKWATHAMGALFGAVLGFPAVAYLIDARNRPAPAGEFKTVARLGELEIGVPRKVIVQEVRRDAWTLHPSDVVGQVWLIRRDRDRVDAYTTICPHLGCSINFQDGKDPKDRCFLCPCHGGTFHLSGECVPEQQLGRSNPAPRGMDRLETRLDPANPEYLQVKYQNFIQGKETAIPKA